MRKLLVLTCFSMFNFIIGCLPDERDSAEDQFRDELLLSVNSLRTAGCKCGNTTMPPVVPLQWNALLQKAATRHVKDMASKNHLTHEGSDGSSTDQRVTEVDYAWTTVGENIAVGYNSIPEVVVGWQKSEGHCKNLMNAAYTEMGVARQGTYWSQTLARPR